MTHFRKCNFTFSFLTLIVTFFSTNRRIYNKMLSFSWFCKDFTQNIDNLPSFYPFFAKNCKESRPDGLIFCG